MFKKWELAVFMLIGKIVAIAGGVGAIITMAFDKIAGRVGMDLGPMQILGIFGFIALAIFGVYADIFLNDQIKPIIKDYMER